MSDTVQCGTHGECTQSFVCEHLEGESVGLGFNRNEPTVDDAFPDAWCDDCEIVRAEHGGWNEQSEALVKMVVQCSDCYERARIRNTRPTVTLDDLADLKWKCHTCEEWHSGACLDFSYRAPCYWSEDHEKPAGAPACCPGS